MSPHRTRSFLGVRLDKQIPITWLIAGVAACAGFMLTEHNSITNAARVNDEQEKELAQIRLQMDADRKANQEIRESVIAFNGKMDTLNAKIDSIRTMVGISSVEAKASGR